MGNPQFPLDVEGIYPDPKGFGLADVIIRLRVRHNGDTEAEGPWFVEVRRPWTALDRSHIPAWKGKWERYTFAKGCASARIPAGFLVEGSSESESLRVWSPAVLDNPWGYDLRAVSHGVWTSVEVSPLPAGAKPCWERKYNRGMASMMGAMFGSGG